MNIYSQFGAKVVFNGTGGYQSQKDRARSLLNVGSVYTVNRTVVHSTSTEVYLVERPGESFNSVHFDDYIPISEAIPDTYHGFTDTSTVYSSPAREWSVDRVQFAPEPEVVRETFTSGGGGDFGGGGATGSWDSGSNDSSSDNDSSGD